MSIEHQLFMETLRRTHSLPVPQLGAYCDRLLESMARHAYEKIPFYRERLSVAFPGGVFDRRNWTEVPLLTRREAQAAGDSLHAPPMEGMIGKFFYSSTSGSTGEPFNFRLSSAAAMASECFYERCYEIFGIDRLAAMGRMTGLRPGGTSRSPYPLGSSRTGWNFTFANSSLYQLEGTSTVAEQADWLLRRRPTYISAYPSTVQALSDHMGGQISFGAIFTVGESVTPDIRRAAEAAFSCRLIDNYGSNEFGRMANQCPDGGLHVCAEAMLLELLRDEGLPAAPGEVGRVVVSTFYNHVQPLLRYVMGDYAVWADEPCSCGCTLPRLQRIVGRHRGMFHFPDGSQIWPYMPYEALLQVTAARRIQVVQTALDRVELHRVPDGGNEPDPAQIDAFVRRYLHPAVSATVITRPALEQLPSGKMEIYVCRVGDTLNAMPKQLS